MLESPSMPHFHNFSLFFLLALLLIVSCCICLRVCLCPISTISAFFFLLCYKLHPLLSQYLPSFLFSSSSQFSLHSYTIHIFYRKVQPISPIVKHTPTYIYTHLIASQPSWLIFSHGLGHLRVAPVLRVPSCTPSHLKKTVLLTGITAFLRPVEDRRTRNMQLWNLLKYEFLAPRFQVGFKIRSLRGLSCSTFR